MSYIAGRGRRASETYPQNSSSGAGGSQLFTATLTLADLQAAGAVSTAFFPLGTLPVGARIVNPVPELVVNQALGGEGFDSFIAELQGGSDEEGTMGLLDPVTNVADTYAFTGGSNPYLSRSGQAISLELLLDGLNFSALNAGNLTVNLIYEV